MIALMVGMIPLSIGAFALPYYYDCCSIHPFHWIETGRIKGQLAPLAAPIADETSPEPAEVKGVGPSRAQPQSPRSTDKDPDSVLARGLIKF